MFSIFKKEINTFFASSIAYLVIGVFLLINGLFLWVFRGDFNILEAGFADLNAFFFITPWFFIFLIPAVTMRSFSDEMRLGTIEILKTKPMTNWQIVMGKYAGAVLLIFIALIPTVVYIYSIFKLGNPIGNLDWGSTIGSYIGLVLLGAAFTSIGIFTSTLSSNQIIAFLFGVILSYLLFAGFDALQEIDFLGLDFLTKIGMKGHFESISRGVIDTRDVLYFVCVIYFFLALTKLNVDKK
ncbi:MAG: gliding motility-associated ABC transporter permease subunit GldF [Lutimonas sp.]